MLLFSSACNEYTVISKEFTGPLDFDITGVECIYIYVCIHWFVCYELIKEIGLYTKLNFGIRGNIWNSSASFGFET